MLKILVVLQNFRSQVDLHLNRYRSRHYLDPNLVFVQGIGHGISLTIFATLNPLTAGGFVTPCAGE